MATSVKKLTLILYLALAIYPAVAAEDIQSRQYKIKAVYLYNLIKFVSWPELSETAKKRNTSDKTATNTCVYGENPFNDKLAKRTARGRAIIFVHILSPASIEQCEIVFYHQNRRFNTELAPSYPHKLSAGKDSGFRNKAGLIRLVLQDNSVQMHINLTEAKKNGFSISANLLEVAKVVT
jgi:hypothetical protein